MKYLVFGLLLLMSSQLLADKYLCITDETVGFTFDKRKWKGAIFNDEDKYIITTNTLKKYKFSIFKFGEMYAPIAHCKNGFDRQFLSCKGRAIFTFNKKLNRFILASTLGYASGVAPNEPKSMFCEGCNTPYMKIGKCSKI